MFAIIINFNKRSTPKRKRDIKICNGIQLSCLNVCIIIIIIWNHASKHCENISKYKLPCMKKRNRLKRRRCQMFDNNRSPTGYDLFLFSSNFLSFKNTPGPKSINNHTLCSTCRLLDFSIFISFHIQTNKKKNWEWVINDILKFGQNWRNWFVDFFF